MSDTNEQIEQEVLEMVEYPEYQEKVAELQDSGTISKGEFNNLLNQLNEEIQLKHLNNHKDIK